MPVARLVLVLALGLAACERAGPDFIITNGSTQPWFDVTVALYAVRL